MTASDGWAYQVLAAEMALWPPGSAQIFDFPIGPAYYLMGLRHRQLHPDLRDEQDHRSLTAHIMNRPRCADPAAEYCVYEQSGCYWAPSSLMGQVGFPALTSRHRDLAEWFQLPQP